MDIFAAETAAAVTESITIKAVLGFFTVIIGKELGGQDQSRASSDVVEWRVLLLKLSTKIKVNNKTQA